MPKTDYAADIKELKSAIAEVKSGWPKEYGAFTKTWQQVQALSNNGSLQEILVDIEAHVAETQAFEAETAALKAECKKKTKEFDKLVKGGGQDAKLQGDLMAMNLELDKTRPKKLKELEGTMKTFQKRFGELTKQLDALKKSVIKQKKQKDYFNELIGYCDAKYDELVGELKGAAKNGDSDALGKQLKEVEALKSDVRKANQLRPETLELEVAINESQKTIPADVAKRMKALGLK